MGRIKYIYDQIDYILGRHRFVDHLVLAMGHGFNIRIMARYLKCYDLEFKGILDNDPEKWGTWSNGCKIFSPEEILYPYKKNALILVFSPKYAKEMKEQLEDMGYEENRHFYLIDDFRRQIDSWDIFHNWVQEAARGWRLYRDIQKKYGKNTHIFVIRGATGDVLLNCLYLRAYAKHREIEDFVIVGDGKGLKKITSLFGFDQVVPLSLVEGEAFQQCYRFLDLPNITNLFLWQLSLYLNRCQTRMHEGFTFMDTYDYYIYGGVVARKEWEHPQFLPLDEELKEKYEGYGIKPGRTILISPFAYSVANLPIYIWEEIVAKLRKKGYQIIANINVNIETNPFEDVHGVFVPFNELEALLTYAGHFLGLRSGLCDIVAMVPCKQVVLYPEEMNPIDYKIHRSDNIFSGLEELVAFGGGTIREISSPIIRDIASNIIVDLPEREWKEHCQKLIDDVVDCFDECNESKEEM